VRRSRPIRRPPQPIGTIDASIIITTRDRWPALTGSLHAALSQTGVTVEVILVDDASQTPPPPEVERLLADERVVYQRLPVQRHRAAAANHGVRDARGDWIAFLQDTDLWAPEHIATVLEACGSESADFGYSAAWVVDDERRIRGFLPAPTPDNLEHALLEANILSSSAVVFRPEIWQRAGGYDEWLGPHAEWDLWIRWSRIGRGCMVSTATVASLAAPHRDAGRELRELKRRYGRDAKRAGIRFGSGAADAASEPPLDVLPPWLADESRTQTT
jgi:glycosyltransferase involved in cell wall biosynthesis